MEELEKLRKEIDQLDKMIAELIFKRQDLVIEAVKHKTKEQIIDEVIDEFNSTCNRLGNIKF